MKIPIVVLALLFLIIIRSSAQIINSYGLKAGVSSSFQTYPLTSDEDYSSDSRFGIDAGIFVELFNNKRINLLAEAHFIQKGMKVSKTEKTRLNYLSFPLLAKFNILSPHLSLHLTAGPRADILLGYNEGNFTGIYKSAKKINYGMTLGAGISRKISAKTSLLAEFRFSKDFTSFSVTDYYLDSYHYTFNNGAGVNFKTTSLEFLVGVSF